MTERESQGIARKPRHQLRDQSDTGSDRMLPLRNVLNIIFMLGAIAGVIVYWTGHSTTGIIIVLAAMAVKMVECVIRMTVK